MGPGGDGRHPTGAKGEPRPGRMVGGPRAAPAPDERTPAHALLPHTEDFADLLAANATYAESFAHAGVPGVAGKGVTIVTCMDSRIDPLAILGLEVADAKVLRNPGGQLTEEVLQGLILAVHLLQTDWIMIVPHTRCAMGSGDDAAIAAKVKAATDTDLSGMVLGSTPDQRAGLQYDVELLRTHPLMGHRAEIGGFLYDVDTGRLTHLL